MTSGYTPHDGLTCPAPGSLEVRIQVRLQDEPVDRNTYPAKKLRWHHRGDLGDIIAWRPA